MLKGYTLGLVSNGKTPFQEKNFYALELTDYFSIIVISEAIGLRKPDPEIYLYTCNQLDCKPSECIFIGDNPKADIEGAKKIGMKTIYFHPLLPFILLFQMQVFIITNLKKRLEG